MCYFKKAKKNDKVFGSVFGIGVISNNHLNGYYSLMVKFNNGFEVPYTIEGIPAWGNFDYQTLFYKNDIDITDLDFDSVDKVLKVKQIIKLRDKKKLEIKCPSGIWQNSDLCSDDYIEEILSKKQFWLFRKK